jgi:hypothetical protein
MNGGKVALRPTPMLAEDITLAHNNLYFVVVVVIDVVDY